MGFIRRLLLGGILVACVAAAVSAQPDGALNLSRQQRMALQALVRAAETALPTHSPGDRDWAVHILRASDGSHYVAFSINRADGVPVGRPFLVYVRLASRRDAAAANERSAVAEWLAGQSPTPILPRRGIAFGEMPTYGAGSIATRGPGAQSQGLQLLELERERAREKREAQERARKAALEGEDTSRALRPMLPFEDFDVRATATVDSTGTPVIRRSLTAGPGEYDLTVAWSDGSTAAASVKVARRTLSLPPAPVSAFALSSVIVAEDVSVRETSVAPSEQTRHPYSIGGTEIVPARDHVFTPEERLALVVQVINSRAMPTGKPDVAVSFRVFRKDATREDLVGTLAPQLYNEITLPADFDVTKGHPIFAAVAVPLRAFKRGEYRLEVTAADRVAGVSVAADVGFSVVSTPASLLKEAPALVPAFDAKRNTVPPTAAMMLGAIRAAEGNDRAAIAAWENAVNEGNNPTTVWPFIVDAWLRQGDTARAIEMTQRGLAASPNHPRFTRQLATAYLLAGREDEALLLLEAHLRRNGDDLDAQWLVLRTLFAGFVAGTGAGATVDGRARLLDLARQYVAGKGPHSALALDWATAAR